MVDTWRSWWSALRFCKNRKFLSPEWLPVVPLTFYRCFIIMTTGMYWSVLLFAPYHTIASWYVLSFICRYEVKGSHVKGGFLSELHIGDTIKSDSGTFTCIAKNPYGKAERIIHLQVQGMSLTVVQAENSKLLNCYALSYCYYASCVSFVSMCLNLPFWSVKFRFLLHMCCCTLPITTLSLRL